MSGVQHNSRAVVRGDLFVAIRGTQLDGTRFVPDALERGALAVLADRDIDTDVDVPLLIAEDARRSLSLAAEAVYGDPTSALDVVGITGTNGKTTTAWLVESAIAEAGGRPGLMGTVTFRGPAGQVPALHTTPEGDDIARFARDVRDAGGTHLVMEVSSHGLAMHRVDGVRFRVAAFTNLSQDHLDYHGDLERYGQAKERLFTELSPEAAVINLDDDFGAGLAERVDVPLWRCSARAGVEAELRVVESTMGRAGIRARVATPVGERVIESPLLGTHNLENLLVALGCCLALGLDADAAVRALSRATGAPGRLERVPHPGDVAVLVDYAHTPAALENALAALGPITPGRLIVVFGCGGDRDRSKRPLMGEAAARGADVAIVTSDNPRSEDPRAIIEEIEPGVSTTGRPRVEPDDLGETPQGYCVVTERRAAIELAMRAARPGDTVLIAGKGHETYQVIGYETRDFDDRAEARRAIEGSGETGGGA